MKKRLQILTILLILGAALISACAPPPPPVAPQPGLANPASVHCQKQGFALEVRSDAAGNQFGVCVFPDGSECEEWAYFRGECQPPSEEPIGMANPAAVHCQEQGHQYEIRSDDAGNQFGVCIFPDGSECDAWAYFRGECQPGGDTTEVPSSDIQREPAPPVAAADLDTLAAGNSAFAFDLFQTIRPDDKNLFFSPYSISLALAMTYAGARTETEQQMADTLHFSLGQDDLHPTFNALDQDLAGRSEMVGYDEDATGFQLNIANALWGQEGYGFLPEFLNLLAANYGAGMNLLDFATDPEAARNTINDWVSDQTEERIQDLLPPGSLDALTRLVLTNAIYFNAAWLHPFEEHATADGPFTLLDGSEIMTPMMAKKARYGYVQGAGYQAVQLPYIGNQLSMVVLMPAEGEFEAFSSELDAERLAEVMRSIRYQEVNLTFPKFTFESETQLRQALTQMGMTTAFDAAADFSGMDGSHDLFIDDVYHKAFVAVDEAGTEAAAATAVVMALKAALPEEATNVTIDHPFLFLIQDNPTGAILFVGQVVEPEQ